MDDDFNTPMAFAVLFEMASELNRLKGKDDTSASQLAGQMKALAGVVGLLQQSPKAFLQQGGDGEISGDDVEALILERKEARANRDFARSDEIRDQLAAAGVILKDGPDGTTWYREG
ncbi:MAG: Cysteine--tRNA ligase [Marinobacterium sp. xm-d-530]|nr:MAG: Cysteine--tRNA ligase [Marinobacterium sp. xm-d-530]